MADAAETVHGTAVAISTSDGARTFGVLIRGPSGSGKSDLALRLIQSPVFLGLAPAQLVCDDQVMISTGPNGIVLQVVDTIAGRIEVRGVGILAIDHLSEAPLSLVVDATPTRDIPRLPDPAPTTRIHGCNIPHCALALCEPSAPAKLYAALSRLCSTISA